MADFIAELGGGLWKAAKVAVFLWAVIMFWIIPFFIIKHWNNTKAVFCKTMALLKTGIDKAVSAFQYLSIIGLALFFVFVAVASVFEHGFP